MTNKEALDSLKERVDLAIKALEKQVPEKPIILGGAFWNAAKSGECPVCKAQLNSKTYIYCRNCGQAIDWD